MENVDFVYIEAVRVVYEDGQCFTKRATGTLNMKAGQEDQDKVLTDLLASLDEVPPQAEPDVEQLELRL
jgi:hypothetical protein